VLFLDQFPRNWLEKPEEEKRSEPGIIGETLTTRIPTFTGYLTKALRWQFELYLACEDDPNWNGREVRSQPVLSREMICTPTDAQIESDAATYPWRAVRKVRGDSRSGRLK